MEKWVGGPSFEPRTSFQVLCDEAKTVFAERYAGAVTSGFGAGSVSHFPPKTCLFVRESSKRKWEFVLQCEEHNRASDMALLTTYEHLSRIVGTSNVGMRKIIAD